LNNLNTADAVLALRAKEKSLSKSPSARANAIATAADLLKLNLTNAPLELSDEIKNLVRQRSEARIQKNWALSDQLRDELTQLGYEVSDASSGTQLRRAILPPT